MKIIRGILLCCIMGIAQAQSLNGLFPISEMSVLTLIEEQLRHPSTALPIDSFETYALQWVANYADKTTTSALPRATQENQFVYTPTIKLPRTIYNTSGRLIFQQGTVINVLKQLPTYQPNWIFIDAQDAAQLQWAKNQLEQLKNIRVILVNRPVFDAASKLQHEVFFDERGYISQKLGIKHLPARVTRQNDGLLIQEISAGFAK